MKRLIRAIFQYIRGTLRAKIIKRECCRDVFYTSMKNDQEYIVQIIFKDPDKMGSEFVDVYAGGYYVKMFLYALYYYEKYENNVFDLSYDDINGVRIIHPSDVLFVGAKKCDYYYEEDYDI